MKLSQVDVIGDGSISTEHSFSMPDPNVMDARVIVLDLHDGHEVPENVDAVIADKTSLSEYITVERDTGMSLMRTLLLKIIPGSIGIHVRAPRGIVDANRHPEYALPLNFPQAVSAALMQTHANAQTAIRNLLDHCSTKVVVLDLHSMSPKSPDGEAPRTTTDTLHEHVLYWERSLKTGTPRDIDIIDSDESGIIGDRALSQRIGDCLGDAGYRWVFNKPYAKSRKHHPIDFIEDRGVSVDYTKDLATENAGEEFSLLNSRPSLEKIMALVAPLEQAVLRYLKERK